MNNEQQKFYDEYVESGKFNWWQMRQIRLGVEHRLTPEQVATYADPKFNWEQMEQIRKRQEKQLSKHRTNRNN